MSHKPTTADEEWTQAVHSRRVTDAAHEPFSGPIPRCVREPIVERYEAHTSVIETFAAVLLIIGVGVLFFGGIFG
jgi:hypothetical protein